MFRSIKRNALVKRLWRNRVLHNEATGSAEGGPVPATTTTTTTGATTGAGGAAAGGATALGPSSTTTTTTTTNNNNNNYYSYQDEMELKSVSHTMLKRLRERQLDVLIQSVESKGGETTDCVLLPKGELRVGRRTVSAHVLCCQLWRWPNITPNTEMKRLPCCTTADDPAYVCCNPYHWSLLMKSGDDHDDHDDDDDEDDEDVLITQEPQTTLFHNDVIFKFLQESLPASICRSERVKSSTDRLSMVCREPVSTETGLTPTFYRQSPSDPSNGLPQHYWCSIAYWELKDRVGRLFRVFQPSINVFQLLPHGDGMCLAILQNETTLKSVRKTREKLGLGITLSKEGNGVWAYNRSTHPIFVNSPTLEVPNSRTLVVRKVLPGYSMKIFDYKCSEQYEAMRDPQLMDGPYDPSSIRISFAKGWGPYYSRQFVTSCPCWIEVLLNVNR